MAAQLSVIQGGEDRGTCCAPDCASKRVTEVLCGEHDTNREWLNDYSNMVRYMRNAHRPYMDELLHTMFNPYDLVRWIMERHMDIVGLWIANYGTEDMYDHFVAESGCYNPWEDEQRTG